MIRLIKYSIASRVKNLKKNKAIQMSIQNQKATPFQALLHYKNHKQKKHEHTKLKTCEILFTTLRRFYLTWKQNYSLVNKAN